ncbi:MAG: response regulator [Rhodospirillales bacterium]|nr:response regulator [Rhodospirillales bacterium]MBO6787775.1 response regulator [Rhodospirillales bacterium]
MRSLQRNDSGRVSLLLVEDDDVDIAAVRRALKVLKIENPLHVARDGVEALAILRGENGGEKLPRPYIIMLDLNMPRMDGREFLQEVRRDVALQDAVIFIMTTSRDDDDKRTAYDHHVAGYIVKEDPIGSFRETINLIDHYARLVELP